MMHGFGLLHWTGLVATNFSSPYTNAITDSSQFFRPEASP
jgi:hypothetical protein